MSPEGSEQQKQSKMHYRSVMQQAVQLNFKLFLTTSTTMEMDKEAVNAIEP